MALKLLGSMSDEAVKLQQLLRAQNTTFIDNINMSELRKSIDDECKPASELAIKQFACEVSDIKINGVQTMQIIPRNVIRGRQILYIFGGGFTTGSPFNDLVISAQIANYTKSTVFCPYYRLAPENPFPAALDDIFKVAKQLWSTSDNPPLLMGESAGATLALSLTHLLKKHGLVMPARMGLLSPASDLYNQGDSFSFNQNRDPILTLENVTAVSSIYAGNAKLDDPLLSPIYGSFDKTYPKTLMTSGTQDLLLSSCIRLAKIMREAEVDVELRVWEGMWHVFEYYQEIPESTQSLKEISSFFEESF